MQPHGVFAQTQLLKEERHTRSATLSQTGPLGLASIALCMLVALNATHTVDWWGQTLTASLSSSSLLDLTGFLLTLLGEAHITGAVAVILAVRGWHQRRVHGLGPLLLFVGVGIEVLLKYILPHPGPPAAFARHLQLPAFSRFSTPFFVHFSTPYSFPSGHALRTTFLVALLSEHKAHWRALGWVLVVAMAFTRVYYNMHWVSDVVGGALLGWTLAGVATVLYHEQEGEAGDV